MIMLWVAVILNTIVATFLYPEIFSKVDIRLVQGHETCGPMQYVFYLASQFYQGNIQLFNRYDLFNTSFTQLSVGLYTPINFIIAFVYTLSSWLVDHQAQYFHHLYVLMYYGSGLLLRTFGVYLLTYYLTKSKWVALVSTVWVNSFCALTMIHLGGLCISEVYNYFPLLLFCLVHYWQTRSFKSIACLFLIFILAINNSLYVGLGYFYQTLHLFILDMFLIWIIFQRHKKPLIIGKINYRLIGGVLVLMILIFSPVFWWAISLMNDFQAAASGLGQTDGRFNRIFNPVAMLHDQSRYFISSKELFHHAYDFTFSGWYSAGAFLGITTLLLAVIGLILAKNSYKVIFVSAAVMMAFLNVPSTQGGWMMWAHWIDALTNPFCFLVRSFHYSVLLWYMSLAIPVSLGINVLYAMIKGNQLLFYYQRLWVVVVALIIVMGLGWFIPTHSVKVYVMGITCTFIIMFLGLMLLRSARFKLTLVVFLLIGIVGTEFYVLKTYLDTKSVDMNWGYWDGLRIKPRVYSPMYTPPIPTILDYQNPMNMPVRFFYRMDDKVVLPLLWEFQGMFGQFYQFSPLVLRLEREDSMYVPRLKIFNNIHKDKNMQEYLRKDGRVMYVADQAVKTNQDVFRDILNKGWDRRVIQVDESYHHLTQDYKEVRVDNANNQEFKVQEYVFLVNQATVRQRSEGKEYQWRLPKDIPKYLSTTVLTPDVNLWELSIGNKVLIPAQGALVTPYTFDVNNIRQGHVTLLIPSKEQIVQSEIKLKVAMPAELIDIWKHSHDELGFTYDLKQHGWWVIHLPYDSKWQLYINGKKTPIAKVNNYFIGAPVKAGINQIYLTYWPDSPLRIMIILSTIASVIAMVLAFRWAYYLCFENNK